jgi:lipopolysaccharide cholinephosphotransferase
MNLEELRRIQLMQADALTIVDAICRQNNLKYFMIAGTLLGAVRHSGFVPWDIDSDIAMYRSDYEKFLKIANPSIPPEYTLQYTAVDPDCEISFARMLLNNAFLVKPSGSTSKFHLDIFILDYVEPEKRLLGTVKENILLYLSYVRSYRVNKWKLSGRNAWWKNFLIRSGHIFTKHMNGEDFDNLLLKITKYKNYKTAYTSITSSSYGYVKNSYRTSCFEDVVELDFEGNKRFAPKGYDEILRQTYGEYMVPPPENKRWPSYFKDSKVVFPHAI